MKPNILVVFLVALILTLLIPFLGQYCNSEQAFTPHNLIRIDLVSR
ncbi:MAG: hypothetical protein PHC92_00125 [Syntrophomonadaceae bacterium]|nr:hypothetical protein [Syntrophomonadaceae bacterium]MDD3022436.1 hypothetical protein [Syntrophomonadaceae bacterium]